ncbi:MAG TPA: hypothetical protein PKY81_16300, partial [bacterium]|nr:hypothetical protein [bacterium]
MKKSVGILVLFICLIVCAVLSVKHLINYRSLKTDSDSKIYALAGEVTSQGADKLKEHFLAVKENLDKSLVMINDFDKTGIFNSLKKIMETSENISALGFIEISEFNKAGSANILTKKKIEEFVPIEANSSEYGWIKSAIEKTGSVSKPYFDKNINSISLSVSVSKPLSTGKKIILFALITNKDINEIIQNLDFGRRGYGFVTDAEGNVFLHPRDSFQFRKFTDIVKGKYEPENFNKVESAFSLKQPVLIDEKDFNSFSRKIITIQPIPEIECFIGAILNKAELGFAFSETKNILMKLSVASAFSIFFLCMLISAVTFNPESSFKAFRICSAASAAIFFIVIGCVWMLERIYGLPAPETDKGYISDRASLVKFLDDEKKINISN